MIHLPSDSRIVQHYIRFWGEPVDIFNLNGSWKTSPGPIFIAQFAPRSDEQDWVYATIGASRQPMPYPADWVHEKPERRVELFIYARRRTDELRILLMSLAEYPFNKMTFLGPGHTIPGNEGVVKGSPLTDILFIRPLGEPPEFEVIHSDKAHHLEMLWIIPIYESERQFVKLNGWNALIDLFYHQGTDTSNFLRAAVV